MVSPENPRVVLSADVLLASVLIPHSDSAQLLNLILDGHIIPVLDARLASLYSFVLGSEELMLPHELVAGLLIKMHRISDITSPSPLPRFSGNISAEDILYYQVASSAGGIPIIKNSLRYYLGSETARNIPVFTPSGFMEELPSINLLINNH